MDLCNVESVCFFKFYILNSKVFLFNFVQTFFFIKQATLDKNFANSVKLHRCLVKLNFQTI